MRAALLLSACILAIPTMAHAADAIADPVALHAVTDPEGLDPKILDAALTAWDHAHARVTRSILTVIDYDLPSTSKRLWVVDVAARKLLFHELVAHGKGSGDDLATVFGNGGGSNRSSVGVFLTAETYEGKHGFSLKLDGLEKGINDRARERDIVFHAADYVSDDFAKKAGRLGRSWGCPAVNPAIAKPLIDAIKGGSLVFVYADEPGWLASSEFLRTESASARPISPPASGSPSR
jgi:hypothetical protein